MVRVPEEELKRLLAIEKRDAKAQEAIWIYMQKRTQGQKDWLVDRILWIYDEEIF
jgi:hypothetical protein